jgi:proteasome lid subunit RPN8/RPN11
VDRKCEMISERTKMRCRLQQAKRATSHFEQTVKAEMPGEYETAFTVCERNNQLVRGNAGAGGPYAVSVDIGCPDGYRPIALWHSHPHGTAQPSSADISEMQKLGLEHCCISVPQTGELQCHRIPKR